MVSYLICVAVGIFPSYINSALTDTTGSIPRLATAKTLSPLNIKCIIIINTNAVVYICAYSLDKEG